MSGADLETLRDAVTVADQIEKLKPMLAVGLWGTGPTGKPMRNPAWAEHRQLVITKARLLAAIRVIGDVSEDEHDRPQRRSGVRGVYGKLRAVQ